MRFFFAVREEYRETSAYPICPNDEINMKMNFKNMNLRRIRFLLCAATVATLSTLNARANVYATDIKVNGSLYGVTNSPSSPVTITYHLNQAATLGCTVSILSGGATVATTDGGTNMGLNT